MPSFMKKTMVYLGLVDDDYDDYDDYEEQRPARGYAAVTRPDPRQFDSPEPAEPPPPAPGTLGRIRTLQTPASTPMAPNGPPPAPAPGLVATAAPMTARSGPVRAVSVEPTPRVEVVAPQRFPDAASIADYLKQNRPVIVNLQVAERDLQRRMIDFCSGVTYALSGKMDKVADEVFLLTPANVKVSDEERQRLQERGLVRP